jgi:Arc/MetJ family transcription regulator
MTRSNEVVTVGRPSVNSLAAVAQTVRCKTDAAFLQILYRSAVKIRVDRLAANGQKASGQTSSECCSNASRWLPNAGSHSNANTFHCSQAAVREQLDPLGPLEREPFPVPLPGGHPIFRDKPAMSANAKLDEKPTIPFAGGSAAVGWMLTRLTQFPCRPIAASRSRRGWVLSNRTVNRARLTFIGTPLWRKVTLSEQGQSVPQPIASGREGRRSTAKQATQLVPADRCIGSQQGIGSLRRSTDRVPDGCERSNEASCTESRARRHNAVPAIFCDKQQWRR